MTAKKTAWLVGVSSGMGREFAFRLAAQGWQIAISARREKALQEMHRQNENLVPFPVDITDAEALKISFAAIEEQLGAVDLCLFNAGDYKPMPLAHFDRHLFRKLYEVNYLGVVNALEAVIPSMTARQQGQILVTASLAAYRGLPKSAPYSASKAAVLNLAEALHLELKQQGVLLRVINPGFVESTLTAKNDFKMPFLISEKKAAGYIIRELKGQHFEIRFPKRFAWIMRFLALLPYAVYFRLTQNSAK